MADCTWPVSYAGCDVDLDADGVPDFYENAEQQALVEEMATDFLRQWTGGGFGLCEVTVRPCREGCDTPSTFWGRGPHTRGSGLYYPALVSGQWRNVSCGTCSGACSCSSVDDLRLPGPIHSVVEVLIDGQVLDPTLYRVDNYSLLVREDGQGWPMCQDMSQPLEEGFGDGDFGEDGYGDGQTVGTWGVTYLMGRPVPRGGQVAAGLLAREFMKALCRDDTCALPERIKNITREGVTVTLMDDFKDLDGGKTGLWMVDSWVISVTKAPIKSTVLSVDVPKRKVRTTTWRAQ